MRKAFDAIYSGQGMPYAFSYANEVVTKAMCVFRMTRGNTWQAMMAGVNMGRDTDCLTAVAAGYPGALSGAAMRSGRRCAAGGPGYAAEPYTNSQRTLREHAGGLYEAFRARLGRMKGVRGGDGGGIGSPGGRGPTGPGAGRGAALRCRSRSNPRAGRRGAPGHGTDACYDSPST